VFVALGIQHAKRMRHIAVWPFSLCHFFHIITQKTNLAVKW